MFDRPFTLANRNEILDITAFYYGDEHVEEKVRDLSTYTYAMVR